MTRLLLFAALLFCSASFAQQTQMPIVDCKVSHPSDWEIYYFTDDFKVEYKFVDCDPPMGYDKEMVLLRLTNTSRGILEFDWHMKMWYDGECKTCDWYDEYHYTVTVNPESQVEGSCDMYADHQTKIFSAFIDVNFTKGDKLTSFELGGLTALPADPE